MNIFSLIVTIFVLSFVMTEALYVHKIMDQAEPVPKTVQMCRRSCLKNVRIILTEEFNETKFNQQKFSLQFINENISTQENIDQCSSNSMCFMCWDYCGHLYLESRLITVSMCSDYVCVSIL